MSRTGSDASSGLERTAFDRVAVYAIPLVILFTVLALVLYGEALTHSPLLARGVRITFVEGRFFAPVLGVLLLPLSRATRVESRDGVSWAGWAMLIGTAGILAWSLVWLIDAQY